MEEKSTLQWVAGTLACAVFGAWAMALFALIWILPTDHWALRGDIPATTMIWVVPIALVAAVVEIVK
jgi:hypothetical protein